MKTQILIRKEPSQTDEVVYRRWLRAQLGAVVVVTVIFFAFLSFLEAYAGEVTVVDVTQSLESRLKKQLPKDLPGDVHILLRSSYTPVVTSSNATLRWRGPNLNQIGPQVVFQLWIEDKGTVVSTQNINVSVTVECPVWVSKHVVFARTVLSEDDFARQTMEISPRHVETIPTIFPTSVQARTVIPQGAALTVMHFEPMPIVRAGSQVDILMKDRGVQVRMTGVARHDGIKSEIIGISTKTKLLQGRVIGPSLVEIL